MITKDRISYWSEDLEQLKKELPEKHKNLFFNLKMRDFNNQIEELKRNIANYDDLTIIISMAAIVASAGDSHTCLVLPVTRYLPIEFFYFEEGIFIIGATREYLYLIGHKVLAFNDIPILEVIDRVTPIVAHENESFLKSQLPKYLTSMEVLYGLGITNSTDTINMTTILNDEQMEVLLPCFSYSQIRNNITRNLNGIESELPLYRRNQGVFFWKHNLEGNDGLYFNYNSCRNMDNLEVEQFCEELKKNILKNGVKKLVIDIRNNLGGNSTLLEPFIRWLRGCEKLNTSGGIYVILGRDTFSSALLNAYSFKNKTKAIFIGEPSGGKPNCYGEVQYFSLANSELKIRYSTQYYKIVKDDKLACFYPDVEFQVKASDYFKNVDACMDFILNCN